MITCKLQGGLGNQLFQIFTTIAYSLEHSCPFIFLNQFQLNTGNNGETIRYSYWTTFLKALQPFLRDNIVGFELYKEPNFSYNKLINNLGKSINTVLLGYFQSYKYFEKYKATITRLIKLNDLKNNLLVQLKEKYILNIFNFNNTISMHFRIGDYKLLPDHYIILPIDYYRNALLHILNNANNTVKTVLYFCELSELTEVNNIISNLKIEFVNVEFITFVNKQLTDWEELLLMSCCQHNIIANSSFSWWGAYLSNNPNQITCYPSKWFGPLLTNKNDTSDLFPPTWSCISF